MVTNELIKWYPVVGTFVCPPEYNYLGEKKNAFAFCPKCFNAIRCQYEFSQVGEDYGWKVTDSTHVCE